MASVKVLIPTGFGENCSQDVATAFESAGAKSTIAHINDIISKNVDLHSFQIFNWGGGFLDGDELGAAKAGANRLMLQNMEGSNHPLIEDLIAFHEAGNLIGAQCNGFQLLIKAGLLPGVEQKKQQASLVRNDSGRFENRWVHLKVNKKSPCVWTRGIDSMFLPVRHGEGKLVASDNDILLTMKRKNFITLQYADARGTIAQKYPDNPNGSILAIAGLNDKSGRIFGLMPHPEAFIHPYTHPFWGRRIADFARKGKKIPLNGDGFQIFRNAVEFAKEELI